MTKTYEFKIWVIGISRALSTRNVLDFYMNLDNKKLVSSFFNAMAIKVGRKTFEELQGFWISGIGESRYYKVWSKMAALDKIILALGVQYDTRFKDRPVPVPPFRAPLFNELYKRVYETCYSDQNLLSIFDFDPNELKFLLSLESSQQAELVFKSPHRYERYNKYWKKSLEDIKEDSTFFN